MILFDIDSPKSSVERILPLLVSYLAIKFVIAVSAGALRSVRNYLPNYCIHGD